MRLKKLLMTAAAGLFSIVATTATVLGADTITWKMASSWPEGTILQEAADNFAAQVTKMSNGRLTIKSYPAGVLMGALEVTDSVRMGVIDASHSSPGYVVGQLPAAPLFGYIPFGMEAIPYLTWMYDGEGYELFKELYKRYDYGYVAPCGILPSENLAWSNKAITSMEDFKGMKFRTSGYWGEILSAAGASVMMLPAGEVYEALQRKVIDAGEFSVPNIDKDLAFYEIADYLLVPGIHQTSTIMDLRVNKRSWNKLPEDLREIVRVAAKASTMELLTRCISRDVPAIEFFKKRGVKIQYLDPKIQKALAAKTVALMEEKGAKDPFFKKVWESQQRFRADYDDYKALMTPSFK
ncbi:TRAP transporter substrate-binding protein DctP [Desulfogranum mediterraneum]|uniref:TRAP transporter substrate-binding protein DctP n=1 Tax=Desulfogranum mediterraneum TaxID=160661 RepID=UPI000418E821|nr:TRAP transporter substrate-binding protein DctP [Desulfogranum mediterraneum]